MFCRAVLLYIQREGVRMSGTNRPVLMIRERMEVTRREVTNQNLKLELDLGPNEICLVFVF